MKDDKKGLAFIAEMWDEDIAKKIYGPSIVSISITDKKVPFWKGLYNRYLSTFVRRCRRFVDLDYDNGEW